MHRHLNTASPPEIVMLVGKTLTHHPLMQIFVFVEKRHVINVKIGNTKVTATLRFMIFVAQCSLEHQAALYPPKHSYSLISN